MVLSDIFTYAVYYGVSLYRLTKGIINLCNFDETMRILKIFNYIH